MIDKTLCPILTIAFECTQFCEKDKCAWWSKYGDGCGLLLINKRAEGDVAAANSYLKHWATYGDTEYDK